MHVLMPNRRAKPNTSFSVAPIRANRSLHCSGDIAFFGSFSGKLHAGKPLHVIGPVVVAIEQLGGAKSIVARLLRVVSPRAVCAKGGVVPRGIAGLHVLAVADFAGRPDPHQRLRPHATLGISVHSDEVHAHLRQLAEHGLVGVAVPPVGPLGEIVERLNAAQRQTAACRSRSTRASPAASLRPAARRRADRIARPKRSARRYAP